MDPPRPFVQTPFRVGGGVAPDAIQTLASTIFLLVYPMTPEEQDALRREIGGLRQRLEEMERQQRESREAMRSRLDTLEKRLPAAASSNAAPASDPVILPPPLPEPVWPGHEHVAEDQETAIRAVAAAGKAASFGPMEERSAPPPQPPQPPQAAPFPPHPAPAPPAERPEPSFEMQLGRVWLVRFGIVIFLTGLVLAGNFAYRNWIHHTPPWVKLMFLFLCAGALIETGRRLAKRPAMKTPGEVILGGGLAFFYYCTFAAHHVRPLKVIDGPATAGVLLLISAALIGAVSWFRNSRTIAILGIVLASYSTMLQPIGWLSCFSNVLLSAAGVALMLRPGWAAPGVVAMAGTYCAFLGWQVFGASRGDLRDPAVLWFLPPVWVMFSLPGVLGRFRETMGDRARAWFTGVNNGAFFALFSAVWFLHPHHGTDDYWQVCAIFGTVLLGLAIAGRRAGQPAGGANMAQGLALVSAALLVKLEGYSLAFAFGIESLLLAGAFYKYRGRPELVFCTLCALLAAGLVISPLHSIPVWSAGVTCLLLGGAWALLKRGSSVLEGNPAGWAGTAGWIVFAAAVAATICGWCWRLPEFWVSPSLAGIAVVLTGCAVFARGAWKLPEASYGTLVFLPAAMWAAGSREDGSALSIGIAASFILAATIIWHRVQAPLKRTKGEFGLNECPGVPGWAFSVGTVLFGGMAIGRIGLEDRQWLPAICGLQLGLVMIGMLARSGRLVPCAAMLSLPMALRSIIHEPVPDAGLYIAGAAFFSVCFLGLNLPPGNRIGSGHHKAALWILRTACFLAFCQWLHATWPVNAGDAFAISGTVLMVHAFFRRKVALPEAWGFVSLAALWLIWESLTSWWTPVSDPSWRGYLVVAALWILAVGAKTGRTAKHTVLILRIFAPLAASATAIWATQMLVWRFDWKMAAILWSVLGFAFVTTGLWSGLRAFRVAGFVLLSSAVVKVFALDVWDFNAFGRVVSFIVLGGALILLGLFYNRFAIAVKKLLEEEKGKDG